MEVKNQWYLQLQGVDNVIHYAHQSISSVIRQVITLYHRCHDRYEYYCDVTLCHKTTHHCIQMYVTMSNDYTYYTACIVYTCIVNTQYLVKNLNL